MADSRRDFLKTAGLSILGASCVSSLAAAFAQTIIAEPYQGALQAKRWAMIIDTHKCLQKEGCQACIAACHLRHNVPTITEPQREIKWIWKEPFDNVFASQTNEYTYPGLANRPVLVLCNHCNNPPCVRVCPTQATWKRNDGLVMMDEHRCIGCRYCIVGCPYGARSFNWQDPRPYLVSLNEEFPTRTKGVVEKCNFCVDRLSQGQRPACVEACEKIGINALLFGDVQNPSSGLAGALRSRFAIRRKPELGTSPHVFYLI